MDLNKRRYVNYVKALAVAFGLILFDQLTKLTAVENLKGKNPFVIIDGVFQLEYLENRGAAFGIFQGLMPILGFFAGRLFAEAVSAVDHWIAFVLLGFIGGKMLAEALRELRAGEAGACAPQKRFSLRLVLVQAVATSIDALAVGVSLAALAVNIWSAAAFIACVTFACCLVGHAVGRRFGALLGSKAQVLGGVNLIVLGAKILIEHLSGG